MIVAEIGRLRPSIGGTPGDSLCAATRDRMAATAIAQPVPDAQVPAFVADLLRRGALGRMLELHVRRSNPMEGIALTCERV
jgi:hypothetical protein